MNDRERYQRGREIFLALYDLPPAERQPRLQEVCNNQPSLGVELEALFRELDSTTAWFGDSRECPALLGSRFQESPPPERIGAYRLLAELGRGGMGIVYRAEQDHPKRFVALKVIRPELATPGMLRRFRREAEVLGALQHPGIAQVYEASPGDEKGGLAFIAMELVEGLPITRHASEEGLGCAARIKLWTDVCRAVQHAHHNGIIHRDLKPGNVLVDASGRPRVLDFGISRLVQEPRADGEGDTTTRLPLGTIPYMSPEQCGTGQDTDARCDVHALGVIGFELLTGELPFAIGPDLDLFEAARVIRECPPRRARELDSTLSKDLERILGKALEKEPEQRYQTAAELAGDLERLLRGEPILASPQGAGYLLQRLIARHRAIAALLAGTFVLAVAAASLLAVQGELLQYQTRQAHQAKDAANRRLQEGIGLVRSAIFRVYDQLLDVPRSTHARRTVIESVQAFLNGQIQEEAAQDPEIAAFVIEGFVRMGDVLGGPPSTNLGDIAGARAAYESALRVAEQARVRHPRDSRIVRATADVWERLGTTLPDAGNASAALDAVRQALELRRELLSESNENVGLRIGWLETRRILAESLARVEGTLRGLPLAEELLAEVQTLLPAHPEHEEFSRLLGRCHRTFGDLLRMDGEYEGALEHHLESVAISRRRLERRLGSLEARKDLVDGLGRVVESARMVGPDPRLSELARENLDRRRDLVEWDPSDASDRRRLMIGLNQEGEAAFEEGLLDEAEAQFLEASKMARSLSSADANNLEFIRDEYVSATKLSRVADARGDVDRALTFSRGAVETLRRLCGLDPSSLAHERDLVAALCSCGELALRRADSSDVEAADVALLHRESRDCFSEAERMLRIHPMLLMEDQLSVADLQEAIAALDAILQGE